VSEHLTPDEEYADWKAPGISPQQKRPGGELHTRPIQGVDGQWQDGYGETISESEAKDSEYASRFWQNNQSPGLREAMQDNIQSRAESGSFGIFVDSQGITESDKEKLSAYRQLAREMGYEIGPFRFNANSYTATAEIKKVS
jgi:hypothetical protein